MFEGHDPYLVILSIVIAVLGGYTGFGLASRIRGTVGINRRVLLVGAAGFLSVGIWTMHFIGMLAAPLPADVVYLVLPTIVSFLICALVVGVSLFLVVRLAVPAGSRCWRRPPFSASAFPACIMSAFMAWPDILPFSMISGWWLCRW